VALRSSSRVARRRERHTPVTLTGGSVGQARRACSCADPSFRGGVAAQRQPPNDCAPTSRCDALLVHLATIELTPDGHELVVDVGCDEGPEGPKLPGSRTTELSGRPDLHAHMPGDDSSGTRLIR
jgi:hypothetical protein